MTYYTMRNEGIRKSDGGFVVYMVYDWKNGTENNHKEIFDFIDRWAKKDSIRHYYMNSVSSINLVWDYTMQNFVTLRMGYHIVIDTSGRIRVFTQTTFEKLYEKRIPENVEYVFFNG